MKRWFILAIILLALLGIALGACQAAPPPAPTPTPYPTPVIAFAKGAFPPVIPDKPWHKDAWLITDCMGCHKDGVGEAPKVVHKDLPELLLQVNCRTCHVAVSEETTPVKK